MLGTKKVRPPTTIAKMAPKRKALFNFNVSYLKTDLPTCSYAFSYSARILPLSTLVQFAAVGTHFVVSFISPVSVSMQSMMLILLLSHSVKWSEKLSAIQSAAF